MTESTASEGATADRTATGDTADRTATGDELRLVRERADAIRDEAVARAYSQLAARGDPTPEQRAAVAELADRLVEELLAVPASGLREAREAEAAGAAGAAGELDAEANEAVVETVRELFLE